MKKIKLLCIMLVVLASTITTSLNCFAVPTFNSVTSETSGYHFPWEYWNVGANISGSPTAVAFYFTLNAKRFNLSDYGSGNWSGSWYADVWYKGVQNGSSWSLPQIKINAWNPNTGTGTYYSNGYVTLNPRSFYTSGDVSFAYNNSTVNTFLGPATGTGPSPHGTTNTYNCLAYSVGCTTSWQWPWYSNPTFSEVSNYMAKTGTYSSRPGGLVYTRSYSNYVSWADAIYYNGGHFAIVYEWYSDGSPKRIKSKWGCSELIYSGGMNIWGSGSSYGTAQYFFKF